MYDFESLSREFYNEQKNIYVEPESYKLLKNAQTTSEINAAQQVALDAGSSTAKHLYVTRDKYKERIRREKDIEKKRKDDIWQSQEQLISDKQKAEKEALKQILEKRSSVISASSFDATK